MFHVMLLAIRAMTYICDAVPISSQFFINQHPVRVLCAKLGAIEYLDVAKQCVQVLEKISYYHPQACLEDGAVMAVLSYIDFFSLTIQSTLPHSMVEYQRLRYRVAFHALHFRPEIQALGQRMVDRLCAWGQPYLAFHSGLMRDTLAYHGCAELFQVVQLGQIEFVKMEEWNLSWKSPNLVVLKIIGEGS